MVDYKKILQSTAESLTTRSFMYILFETISIIDSLWKERILGLESNTWVDNAADIHKGLYQQVNTDLIMH